jgi:hypothetical protein
MSTIFFATFTNAQFILLLSNGNFHNLPSWIPVFHNAYSDFTHYWYKAVAPGIINAQLTMAVFPWIEATMYIALKFLSQLMDNPQEFFQIRFGCCCCRRYVNPDELIGPRRTKCTTIEQYVEMYSGPGHLLHFKFASILQQIFTAFMYGLFIPILFPITLLGLVSTYMSETLILAYWTRKPPSYD